jgi:Zn-dependent protease
MGLDDPQMPVTSSTTTTGTTGIPTAQAAPDAIHNCPACSHWLPEGTLACPDCQTLTYSQHLGRIASEAQQLEQQQQWLEARDRWRTALAWLPSDASQAETLRNHIAQIDSRLQAAEDQKARWTRKLGPFAPIALFLLKVKSALFLLFKLKFLFSLLAFFGLYWALYGWRFAVGFMAGILIHEMGHFIAVKRRGLHAELPVFTIWGAYVRWYDAGVSREDLAAIALAGPLFGLTAALAYLSAGMLFHWPVLVVLAYFTAFLNIFNLLPLLGFDGAQATYALSRMQRGLVAATCIVFFALTIQGGNLLGPSTHWIFLIVGTGMAWRTFGNDVPEKPSTGTFIYFQSLVVLLGLVILYTYPAVMAIKQ